MTKPPFRIITFDGPVPVQDEPGLTGWVHDCGFFVFTTYRPHRCGQCWSALNNGRAFNGQWRNAFATRGQS